MTYITPSNLIKISSYAVQNYKITIEHYKTKDGYWNYTKCNICKNNELIISLERNYNSFPFTIFTHSNEQDYMICGENYQGYTVVNLTNGTKQSVLNKGHEKGCGFCPYHWEYDYDDNQLKMIGCYWGANEEEHVYDFSNPNQLPLKLLYTITESDYDIEELDELDELDECEYTH